LNATKFEISNDDNDDEKSDKNNEDNEKEENNDYDPFSIPNVKPSTGVFIHGLFLEGAKWNTSTHLLDESLKGELFSQVPVLIN
jgi:hypothetical protein